MSNPCQLLTNALHHSLAHTLEHMVFEEALRVEDPQALSAMQDPHWFAIAITEPIVGGLTYICEMDLLRSIAAQLFGLEPEAVERDLALDAGRELANTVSGHLLAHLMADETFALGIPEDGPGVPPDLAADEEVQLTCMVEMRTLVLSARGRGLVTYAADLPEDVETSASASGGWASVDVEDWDEPPPSDPTTGRWPAGGTWGE